VPVPADTAHSAYEERVFHDNSLAAPNYVVGAGRRTYVAVNASPMDTRKLQRARHAFVTRNDDGLWYRGAIGGWWTHSVTAYAASPRECMVRHRVYVMLLTGVWSEFAFLDFTGQVVRCDATDSRRADGTMVGDEITIQMDAKGAWETLEHV
jgi:hypothetical protein